MCVLNKFVTFILILATHNCKYLGSCSEFDQYSQNENFFGPPRVITDLETIYGCHGVPIDFSYNETTPPEATYLGSVPGCPQSIDGYPWIYYGKSPRSRCYLAGFRGPCKLGEKLIFWRGTPFGTCGCECLMDEENMKILQQEATGRYLYCRKSNSNIAPNGQIYDKNEKRCYNAFETFEDNLGPCKSGTAITEWTREFLTCEKVCSKDTRGLITLVPEEEDCRMVPSYPVPAAGSTSLLRDQACPNGKKYSEKLKMCIREFGIEI